MFIKNFITVYTISMVVRIFFVDVSLAQQDLSSDTLKTYRYNEVVVRAERLSALSNGASFVSERTDIQRMSASSLSDVVSRMGNVFIKDYGGVSGIKTFSQRGLGSEQSLVMLNGMRISSSQNGLVDLGMFPINEIERLEVYQGGLSSFVGADAIGGAMNIVTMSGEKQPTLLSSVVSFGSFGQESYTLKGTKQFNGIQLSGSLGKERSSGDFPFHYYDGNLTYNMSRANADIQSRYAILQGMVSVSTFDELSFVGYMYDSDRGVPAYMFSSASASNARQSDNDYIIQAMYRHLFSNRMVLKLNTQVHNQYNRYRDPDWIVDNEPSNTYFKNSEVRFEPMLTILPESLYSLTVGGEVVRTIADGKSITVRSERNQYSGYIEGQTVVKGDGNIVKNIVFTPAVRFDAFSHLSTVFSPGINGLLTFSKANLFFVTDVEPSIHVNAGRNFRAPTFNELYWNGGGGSGNPDLRPERATNIDAGSGISFSFFGSHLLRATYYSIAITDRVVWVLNEDYTATPKNVRSVSSQGIEALYRWISADNIFAFRANYSYGRTEKTAEEYPGDPTVNTQLPYVPKEMANVSLSVNKRLETLLFSEIGFAVNQQFTGRRFVTEDNLISLPGYNLTNANVRTRSKFSTFSLDMKFQIDNIFNKEYMIMPGYPMPVRTYGITIGFQLQ